MIAQKEFQMPLDQQTYQYYRSIILQEIAEVKDLWSPIKDYLSFGNLQYLLFHLEGQECNLLEKTGKLLETPLLSSCLYREETLNDPSILGGFASYPSLTMSTPEEIGSFSVPPFFFVNRDYFKSNHLSYAEKVEQQRERRQVLAYLYAFNVWPVMMQKRIGLTLSSNYLEPTEQRNLHHVLLGCSYETLLPKIELESLEIDARQDDDLCSIYGVTSSYVKMRKLFLKRNKL